MRRPVQTEPTDRMQADKANAAGWNTPFVPGRVEPGTYVAFNKLPDATWFEVVKVEGFVLTVREGPGYAEQTTDLSLVAQRKDRTGHPV